MKTSNNQIIQLLIELIQVVVGRRGELSQFPSNNEWVELKDLASTHGLLGLILDAIDKLPFGQKPPQMLLLEWIGEVLQGYEMRFGQYRKAIGDLAAFYSQHGFKMMVLKGYACSLDWPKPAHRPTGDIDIWLFGKQSEADAVLLKMNTNRPDDRNIFRIDNGHHHHTVFEWEGFSVENHYDFINVYHHRSHKKLEALLKSLGMDDSNIIDICGAKVYLPSPNLHALFLLKHTMLHFVSGESSLKQLLDWGFFVEKHHELVDWKWLEGVLDEYGMRPAYEIFNTICKEDFGFNLLVSNFREVDKSLKERVLRDIVFHEFEKEKHRWLIGRMSFMFRRWKASEWKHKLCYKESMWSAFWYGVWGHIMKPAHLR